MFSPDPTADEYVTVRRLRDENARGLILYARQWFASEAEDVVQEAFLKLLIETPPPREPKAWLYRVVRNAAVDRQRKQRRFEVIGNWFEEVPEYRLKEPEFDGEALTRALETLDDGVREIIVSKIWGSLTFREIAELIGRPISSVHHDYQKGLDRLRVLLEEKES